jgi:hypothetical protein
MRAIPRQNHRDGQRPGARGSLHTMNWASHAILALARGERCKVTPHGNSMRPRVESGATVTLDPFAADEEPAVDDIVLVKVRGTIYLHLIKALRGGPNDRQFQIGNNRGGINGWVSRAAVLGKAVEIQQP